MVEQHSLRLRASKSLHLSMHSVSAPLFAPLLFLLLPHTPTPPAHPRTDDDDIVKKMEVLEKGLEEVCERVGQINMCRQIGIWKTFISTQIAFVLRLQKSETGAQAEGTKQRPQVSNSPCPPIPQPHPCSTHHSLQVLAPWCKVYIPLLHSSFCAPLHNTPPAPLCPSAS